jgi:hypothetical protein
VIEKALAESRAELESLEQASLGEREDEALALALSASEAEAHRGGGLGGGGGEEERLFEEEIDNFDDANWSFVEFASDFESLMGIAGPDDEWEKWAQLDSAEVEAEVAGETKAEGVDEIVWDKWAELDSVEAEVVDESKVDVVDETKAGVVEKTIETSDARAPLGDPRRSVSTTASRECANCGVQGGDFGCCSRCSAVWYCGKQCQSAHWRENGHREQCKSKRAEVSNSPIAGSAYSETTGEPQTIPSPCGGLDVASISTTTPMSHEVDEILALVGLESLAKELSELASVTSVEDLLSEHTEAVLRDEFHLRKGPRIKLRAAALTFLEKRGVLAAPSATQIMSSWGLGK